MYLSPLLSYSVIIRSSDFHRHLKIQLHSNHLHTYLKPNYLSFIIFPLQSIIHYFVIMAFYDNSTPTPNTWTNSFFIPQIAFGLSKTQVKNHFESNKIGLVSRVDFVSFNNDKGTGRRAFVHFDEYYDQGILSHIEHNGYCDTNIQGHSVRLMRNTNPVPPTRLNIDQIASNTEFIGDEVRVLSEKTEELQQFQKWACTEIERQDNRIQFLEKQRSIQVKYNTEMQKKMEKQTEDMEAIQQQLYQTQQLVHNIMMMQQQPMMMIPTHAAPVPHYMVPPPPPQQPSQMNSSYESGNVPNVM